jgi:hypothetical protein
VKVVVKMNDPKKREVMILQSSIESLNDEKEIDDGPVKEGDRVQFVNGSYSGEGYVIKRHPWMITVHHLTLAKPVRVWPSSVRRMVRGRGVLLTAKTKLEGVDAIKERV